MTKQILMYLVHFHVRHSFVYHHSWTKTAAMMTQITWYWVIFQILDMEKERKKDSWDEITGWTQLSVIINNQIIKIHEEGCFWPEVMGWCTCVKIWIHFIAGDTLEHNNLVGHLNGGRPKFIYQHCKCLFDELSSPIPTCLLIKSEELKQACLTEDGLTNLCKKNISNAFENVPFGD